MCFSLLHNYIHFVDILICSECINDVKSTKEKKENIALESVSKLITGCVVYSSCDDIISTLV